MPIGITDLLQGRQYGRYGLMRGLTFALSLTLFGLLLAVPNSCVMAEEQRSEGFHQWQILEVGTGRSVAFEDFVAKLATEEVIYLGEEHRNRFHIEAAIKILRALLERDQKPVLAMEMFAWDGQVGLDRYLSDRDMGRDAFLQESRWEQNWGGPFDDYEPLLALARDRRTVVLALNPPRPLVRQVATAGLSKAMIDPEMRRLGIQGEQFPEDPEYREKMLDQLRRCHAGLSAEAYDRMYEASVFRDEMMAKVIANSVRLSRAFAVKGGPFVSYTGGGHIQYRLPIPNRVLRRRGGAVRQVTIYLAAFQPGSEGEVQELLRESIADYVWLTPLSAHGAPRRCR